MEKTMIKYQTVDRFEEVEVIGITSAVAGNDINGSIAREKFVGRRILTEQVGFDPAAGDAKTVAKSDGTRLFQTVEKNDETEVFITLANGFKTPGLKLKGGYRCVDTKDNKGAVLVYLHRDCCDNAETLGKIRSFAPRACAMDANIGAFNEWKLEDGDGKRVIVYFYQDVDKNGAGLPVDDL